MTDEEIDAIERACNKGLYGYPAFKLCAELRRRSEEANRSRLAAERERDEARENLQEYRSRAPYEAEQWQKERAAAQDTIDTLMRERDEARAEIARLTGGAGQSAQDPFDHATDVNPPKHAPETVVGNSSLTSNARLPFGSVDALALQALRALLAARGVINEEIDDLVRGWSHGASGKREAVTAEGEAELKPWENALSEIDTALATIRKLVPNAGGESDG